MQRSQLDNIDFVDLWEIDYLMSNQLQINMEKMKTNFFIHKEDFILNAVNNIISGKGKRYTHAIINPPSSRLQAAVC